MAQEFIPDPGFESLASQICLAPDQSFSRLSHWYSLNATPDLFAGNCPYQEQNFVFWDASSTAYEGRNFVGIWSRWNSNGTYFSEGIATRLKEPLKAGHTYLFQMAIRNMGGFQGLEVSVAGCELNPNKHIDLYLSKDSIEIVNDFGNGTATTTATEVAMLEGEIIQSGPRDEWELISTCFVASGGERFFALIMPLGTFGQLPECVATLGTSGVFRSFYYQLDAVSIIELPESLSRDYITCSDQSFEINLMDEFNSPLLKDAIFTWDDGFHGALRNIGQISFHQIEAEISCGTIQLILNIERETCSNQIFIPNAFSPNGDGLNDQFSLGLSPANTIQFFQLTIFDRWGRSIYYSDNPFESWDGMNRGEALLPGIYVWLLKYQVVEAGQVKNITGQGEVLLLK